VLHWTGIGFSRCESRGGTSVKVIRQGRLGRSLSTCVLYFCKYAAERKLNLFRVRGSAYGRRKKASKACWRISAKLMAEHQILNSPSSATRQCSPREHACAQHTVIPYLARGRTRPLLRRSPRPTNLGPPTPNDSSTKSVVLG
jgi:hypothetical protein